MSYTNWAVQLQKMARDLKFLIYYYFTIPMAHFSCMVNPQLFAPFFSHMPKAGFLFLSSGVVAQVWWVNC